MIHQAPVIQHAPVIQQTPVEGTVIPEGSQGTIVPEENKETPKPMNPQGGSNSGTPSIDKGNLLRVSAPTSLPATVVVTLPANATLVVQDHRTTSKSTRRVFRTPALPLGQEFAYNMQIEYTKDGRPVRLSKEVRVRAGRISEVNFTGQETEGLVSR